jgi:hypothetical protein
VELTPEVEKEVELRYAEVKYELRRPQVGHGKTTRAKPPTLNGQDHPHPDQPSVITNRPDTLHNPLTCLPDPQARLAPSAALPVVNVGQLVPADAWEDASLRRPAHVERRERRDKEKRRRKRRKSEKKRRRREADEDEGGARSGSEAEDESGGSSDGGGSGSGSGRERAGGGSSSEENGRKRAGRVTVRRRSWRCLVGANGDLAYS